VALFSDVGGGEELGWDVVDHRAVDQDQIPGLQLKGSGKYLALLHEAPLHVSIGEHAPVVEGLLGGVRDEYVEGRAARNLVGGHLQADIPPAASRQSRAPMIHEPTSCPNARGCAHDRPLQASL